MPPCKLFLCRRLKARAEETIALTEELEEAWNALPDSPAELEAVIDEKVGGAVQRLGVGESGGGASLPHPQPLDCTARCAALTLRPPLPPRHRSPQATEADAMLIANPAALRQYNDRCKAIADQERQLARKEEARQLARAAIDDLSVRGWWPACMPACMASVCVREYIIDMLAVEQRVCFCAPRVASRVASLASCLPPPGATLLAAGPVAAAPEGGGGRRQRHLLTQLPGGVAAG